MVYFWQTDDWPNFTYELDDSCEKNLYAFAGKAGRVDGLLEGLGNQDQEDVLVWLLMEETMKTSAIEGEYLSRADVISSIRNNLGLNATPEFVGDRRAEGAVALTMAVRDGYSEPLCEAMLYEWHRKLMNWDRHIRVGNWRNHKEPMQIISGPVGKEKVHFEAPPSSQVPHEMKRFIQWFNSTAPGEVNEISPAPLRSALAHLYFESIHPFEDGNGRIGRAISEKALSQGLDQPVIMSLSKTIEANKKPYYEELKSAQRKKDVSSWILFFSRVCLKAQNQAERQIHFTLKKSKFLDRFAGKMNKRQNRVVQRMFKEGPNGFEGIMNARKYISITKASKATATRDLQGLLEMGVFEVQGGGRSTHYVLVI